MSLTKQLSQFIGVALSSPFASAIYAGEYDYDDLVGEDGFFAGFRDRVFRAGSIENISKPDLKFHDICEKSIEIAQDMNEVIGPDQREQILDKLVDLGLIEPQITYANN